MTLAGWRFREGRPLDRRSAKGQSEEGSFRGSWISIDVSQHCTAPSPDLVHSTMVSHVEQT